MNQGDTKRKLLLIGPGKTSVHLRNYFHLVKDFFDEVLVISNDPIEWADCKVINFSLKNPLKFYKNIKRVRSIIKTFQPSYIHIHQANSAAYMAMKANKKSVPVVLTTWGTDVLVLPEKNAAMKRMVKYCLNQADVVTADASFMIDKIVKLGRAKDNVLVNFGIDYENLTIPEKENFIYSNRLHADLYNIDQVISQSENFLKTHQDWTLIIGAKGSNTDQLKVLASDTLPSNQFEFIGFVDKDVNKAYYLKSKIWVSIPSSDGTAISLLEAMGYGCIPVVSDLPANREWIQDGVNGVIVNGHLTEALNRALKLNADEVIEMNQKIIESKATKEVNRTIFLEIYKGLD
jgi:glycosyltransferase involved in cell wall biosynthesis